MLNGIDWVVGRFILVVIRVWVLSNRVGGETQRAPGSARRQRTTLPEQEAWKKLADAIYSARQAGAAHYKREAEGNVSVISFYRVVNNRVETRIFTVTDGDIEYQWDGDWISLDSIPQDASPISNLGKEFDLPPEISVQSNTTAKPDSSLAEDIVYCPVCEQGQWGWRKPGASGEIFHCSICEQEFDIKFCVAPSGTCECPTCKDMMPNGYFFCRSCGSSPVYRLKKNSFKQ